MTQRGQKQIDFTEKLSWTDTSVGPDSGTVAHPLAQKPVVAGPGGPVGTLPPVWLRPGARASGLPPQVPGTGSVWCQTTRTRRRGRQWQGPGVPHTTAGCRSTPMTGNHGVHTGLLAVTDLSHSSGFYFQHLTPGTGALDRLPQVRLCRVLCVSIIFLSFITVKTGLMFAFADKM